MEHLLFENIFGQGVLRNFVDQFISQDASSVHGPHMELVATDPMHWDDKGYQGMLPVDSAENKGIDARQDVLSKYYREGSLGYLPESMTQDFIEIDRLQVLMDHPELRTGPYAGLTTEQIRNKINFLLNKWSPY